MGSRDSNTLIMKPMGQMVAALDRYRQNLFDPPDEKIRGLDATEWPSPMQPVAPMAPAGTEPKAFQYWEGQNLWFTPRADAEFTAAHLKELATYPLARMCIENVKDTMVRIPWEIQRRKQPGQTKKELKDATKGDQNLIKLNRFFEYPDREHNWEEWLRPWLDDMLTIDAACILIRKTFKGEIVEMPVIRGESIVRYIDKDGFTPVAPSPAYAQNWWGIPLVELTTDQLIYKPRNIVPRNTMSSQLYGMSPTEQLAPIIEIGIKRLEFVLAYYTEGSIPGVVQVVPRGTSADKISEAMMWMNSELAGNLAKRRQWRMVQGFNEPGKPDQIEYTKEALLSDPYDDLQIRQVAFGYGTSPQRLLRMMNRAASESNQESAEEEGTLAYVSSLKGVVDYIIQKKWGYTDYEMVFSPNQEPDPEKLANTVRTKVAGALKTINEGREELGEEPSDDPMADTLGTIGATFTPIGLAAEQAQAQMDNEAKQADAAVEAAKHPPVVAAGDTPEGGKPNGKPADAVGKPGKKPNGATAAEKTSYGFSAAVLDAEQELGKYSEDELRDEQGRWTGGKNLSEVDKATLNWSHGGATFKKEKVAASRAVKSDHPEKNAIVQGIRDGKIDKVIHRGIAVKTSDKMFSLKSGDKLQLPPQSFTESHKMAVLFANYNKKAGMSRVVLSVSKGSNGIDIGSLGGVDEKEVISGGHYEVLESSKSNGITTIKLKHTGVF